MPLETFQLQLVVNALPLTDGGAPIPPGQAGAKHLTVDFTVDAESEHDLKEKIAEKLGGKLVGR